MTFQIAFHKYAAHLQDKLKTNASHHEWISEALSCEQLDGSWTMVGVSDTVVAKVRPDGSCDFTPLGE
tara:strand:- start:328 stop:531 length:204 start_codon:yes stop_codon:yes gene_type:complete